MGVQDQEIIARRLHGEYFPNDKRGSLTDADWKIATEIEELRCEVKRLKKEL